MSEPQALVQAQSRDAGPNARRKIGNLEFRPARFAFRGALNENAEQRKVEIQAALAIDDDVAAPSVQRLAHLGAQGAPGFRARLPRDFDVVPNMSGIGGGSDHRSSNQFFAVCAGRLRGWRSAVCWSVEAATMPVVTQRTTSAIIVADNYLPAWRRDDRPLVIRSDVGLARHIRCSLASVRAGAPAARLTVLQAAFPPASRPAIGP
jgi:hypothetical protein